MQPQHSVVYLLHFDEPIGNPNNPRAQAQHYIGWADRLDRRIQQHQTGKGARITAALAERGIGFQIAQTWPGSRSFERQLKNKKNARRLCPVCAALAAQRPTHLDDDLL